jgi:hypothetical protein
LTVITADIWKIYKLYGIKGRKGMSLEKRRALAAKLGVGFMSRGDELREKIARLCDSGLNYGEVGKEVGLSTWSIWSHMAKWKKARLRGAATDVPNASIK